MIKLIWERRIGRVTYAIGFGVLAGLIFVLPWLVQRVVLAQLGADAMLSAPRMIFRMYGIMIGLSILAIPIILLTRYRLRDIGLSGAFLLITPMPTLVTLMVVPVASMLTWGLLSHNPLTQPAVLASTALSVALIFAPGQERSAGQLSPFMRYLRDWTDCDGAMGRDQFQKRILVAAGLIVLLGLYPAGVKTFGVGAMGGPYLAPALPLIESVLMVIMVSASARRLHDAGQSCLLAGLFPLGFVHLIGFVQHPEMAKLLASASFVSSNFVLLLALLKPVWGVLSVPALCYLLLSKGDERDTPPSWLAPTALVTLLAIGASPYLVPMIRGAVTGESRLEITGFSMMPSINRGNYVWYKPYCDNEHIASGDVVIVEDRANSEKRPVRVIGLPGDRVQVVAGLVTLNGRLLPQTLVKEIGRSSALATIVGRRQFEEALPSGVVYLTQDGTPTPNEDKIIHEVPEGRVFLLNDNRAYNGRFDSRTPVERGGLGLVNERDILGHVIERK